MEVLWLWCGLVRLVLWCCGGSAVMVVCVFFFYIFGWEEEEEEDLELSRTIKNFQKL